MSLELSIIAIVAALSFWVFWLWRWLRHLDTGIRMIVDAGLATCKEIEKVERRVHSLERQKEKQHTSQSR